MKPKVLVYEDEEEVIETEPEYERYKAHTEFFIILLGIGLLTFTRSITVSIVLLFFTTLGIIGSYTDMRNSRRIYHKPIVIREYP